MTFDKARELARQHGDGIGLALGTKDNPTGFVPPDIDHCIDDQGNIDPRALELVAKFNSYAEITPSGRGLRIWVRGKKPGDKCKRPSHKDKFLASIELYEHSRYLTVTGRILEGVPSAIAIRQTALNELYGAMFPTWGNHQSNGQAHATIPVDISDEALLTKARMGKHGSEFSALYDRGDTGSHGGDDSSADLALLNRLAFWTGCDTGRMETLFSASALGQREKWKSRPNYRARSIDKAIRDCTATYEPKPKPGAKPSVNGQHRDLFLNFRKEKDGQGNEVKRALSMPDLVTNLATQAKGWPKRVGETLFVEASDHKPVYLESPIQVMGWLDGIVSVCWADGSSMVTQARFYEHVRKFTAEKFDAIETLPHYPVMQRTYYMHPAIKPNSRGKLLDEFIGFFSPATDVDKVLIRAAILTVFWGGPPGKRPAFRIDGPENDPPALAKRGTGKSSLVEVLAELVDGYVDLEENEDINDLKTRLLSNEEGRKRILRIDNVKKLSLSWSALEKFITSPVISGHAMYEGEKQRPNTITVFITINSGSFSKDLAQRAVQIQLARPVYSPDWEDKVRKFIHDHRWDLIGEIIGELAEQEAAVKAQSRWSLWERDVLGQCSDFEKCQKKIAERIKLMDDDYADVFEIE